ncbi:MAG: FtsQ-type POTRA domain-containing protein, partial [Myxococcales bacterium]|nr:FtsQ-type POTRA domain-containing protein [Myxococcales bacterium]
MSGGDTRMIRPHWPALLTRRRSALLFGLGALLGVVLGWQPLLRGLGSRDARSAAPRVALVGTRALDAQDLMLAAAVSEGTAFAALDAGVVADRVARHPWVERANAITLPPRRLLLRIVEREPVARVAIAGNPWWVDAEGLA